MNSTDKFLAGLPAAAKGRQPLKRYETRYHILRGNLEAKRIWDVTLARMRGDD